MADRTYPCPCCGTEVADAYDARDALCCWCRDIDDPRLSPEVRGRREQAIGPRRCCLRRFRGEPPARRVGTGPRQGELFEVAL